MGCKCYNSSEEHNKHDINLSVKQEIDNYLLELSKKKEEINKLKKKLNEYIQNESNRKIEIENLKKSIEEKEKEFQNKYNEIKKREEEIIKKERNINSQNNINKAKSLELLKKEKDLINKEKNINEKNEKLSQREINIENNQKIIESKNIELYKREENIKNKEKIIDNKNKELKEKETNIKNIENKNVELNQKELNIKNKEKIIESKNIELYKRETNIINKEKFIESKNEELNRKELDIKNKEKIIESKNIELNQKETNIKNKEKIIKSKSIELNQKELDIKNMENVIDNKTIELNRKESNLKNKEKIIESKNMELNQKDLDIKNKEKDLEQKMIDFEKNKNIINKQNVPILIGLNNIGATCYMNSTLQCLSNTNKLTEYFLTKYKRNTNRIMSNVYYKLLLNLWDNNNNNKSYSPYEFKEVLSKENPLFAGINANDSKDLINFLIERFHQELNEVKANKNNNDIINIQDQTNEQFMLNSFIKEFEEKFNSPISSLFYGMMETKSQCQGCQIIKYNFQVYSFLEFPLQQVNQFCYNNGKRPLFNNDGTNPDINLYECFDYYQKIDLMNGDNQMYCNMCNKLCDSLYSTTIYSGPLILIINLNRGRGAVYECKVNFPEQLILYNYVVFKDGYTAYQLYAVICHLGPSSMSGHFVAYCRNRIDNKWYLYNDGMVSLCTKQRQYQDGMPYILFYKALGD